jgi:hypothetical protein
VQAAAVAPARTGNNHNRPVKLKGSMSFGFTGLEMKKGGESNAEGKIAGYADQPHARA